MCINRQCGKTCTKDALEGASGNDKAATAYVLADDRFYEASLCPGDDDWYKFTTSGPLYFGILALFNPKWGNLDLEIYQDKQLLWESKGREIPYEKNIEAIHRRLADPGTYYLRVTLVEGVGGLPYSLRTNLLPEG